MASSTEEVSGNNETISDRTNQHDTTDTEQKFGMYMREFDFLEYELESLEVCDTTFVQLYVWILYNKCLLVEYCSSGEDVLREYWYTYTHLLDLVELLFSLN